MDEGTTRLVIVCIALGATAIIGGITSCTYHQYKACMDVRLEAIKSGNQVLAASVRCSPQGNN